ncbi:hypothetical protein M9H77_29821 [Catharanthus roseus]|uniref:Uncharacterized protein n=1 Tax=Catharanthus roseus TaxID=4058 RepID=A0ACB9ZXG3_CATRO|nr:hypothetical protein M9H77_29821 [Catharanthus roseus]
MRSVSEKTASRFTANRTETPEEISDPEMVVALGPGKFYGSSLPRPRIYTDVKLNEERVDPPLPVMDPLMSWAEEAHWSMGGLNFHRHRLQGRIEGNVKKLRSEREKTFKKAQKQKSAQVSLNPMKNDDDFEGNSNSPITPPAPVAVKRRRRLVGIDEEEEQEREVKRTARKLGDDFDKVANDKTGKEVAGASRTRSQKAEEKEKEIVRKCKGKKLKGKSNEEAEEVVVSTKVSRSSPRLAKCG